MGTSDSWLSKSIKGMVGTDVNVLIFKNNIRAEVYISSADRERNKRLFDYLYARKEEIEQQFGDSLTWQRLDDKKACRIRIDRNDLSYLEPEQQEEIFAFFLDTSNRLMKAFAPYAKKYNG
jgi:polyphosphate kinase